MMRESASVWLQGCKSDIAADGRLEKIASDLVVIRRCQTMWFLRVSGCRTRRALSCSRCY